MLKWSWKRSRYWSPTRRALKSRVVVLAEGEEKQDTVAVVDSSAASTSDPHYPHDEYVEMAVDETLELPEPVTPAKPEGTETSEFQETVENDIS